VAHAQAELWAAGVSTDIRSMPTTYFMQVYERFVERMDEIAKKAKGK